MTKTDPILRHDYGAELEAAAEAFLIAAFERATEPQFSSADGPPYPAALVTAAFHILNRAQWEQPSDEAIKAATHLYLRELDGPGHPPQDR